MEDNFYNDDGFEEFLQKQVKNHRMYPSDGIWRNIHKKLHGDTNWPALTIAAFAFLAIIIVFSFYFSPSPDFFSVAEYNKALHNVKTETPGNKNNDIVGLPHKNTGTQAIPFVHAGSASTEPAGINREITAPAPNAPPEPGVTSATLRQNNKVAANNEVENQALHLPAVQSQVSSTDRLSSSQPSLNGLSSNINSSHQDINSGHQGIKEPATELDLLKEIVPSTANKDKSVPESRSFSHVQAENAPGSPEQTASLFKTRKTKKSSYLVYITPSKSYRKLNQAPAYTSKSGGPLALNNFVDVNKVVRYNPGTGVEAGVSFLYKITDKLKLSTGVQFNVRQYSLEAYIAPGDISTIALTNRSGASDTISTYAVYRTSNGYLSTELVNRYYEISLPVGLVWQVLGNRNVQLNLAASVQPTYQANRNAYLLSTDFKNYTINPGLMNSWNINTNLEAYISIKSGDFRWQVGPQFRYQNLPTSISRYPIRENLIDYGLKIGVLKDLK